MKIGFKRSFEKDLSRVKDPVLLQRVQAVIEAVETLDRLSDLINLKKLKSEKICYRIKVGDY